MNLFERIKRTISADLHDVLDQKEMKNPIALLNQYLRDCEKEVKKVDSYIERHYQLKNGFFREWKEAEYMAEKRKEQSKLAESAGKSELLQMAMQEQLQQEERAARLKSAYDNTVEQLTQLEQKQREMKLKLKDMQIKRMELMGRENVARMSQRLNDAFYESEANRSFTRFDEVEHYITNLEARVNGRYESSMLDYKFTQLEKELQQQARTSPVESN